MDDEITIAFLSPFRPKRLDAEPFSYSFDDLIELAGSVDHVPAYAIGRKDLAYIRALADDAGRYIWRAGSLGSQSTINGYEYVVISEDDSDLANVFIFDWKAWSKSRSSFGGCAFCGTTSQDSIGRCLECGAGQ